MKKTMKSVVLILLCALLLAITPIVASAEIREGYCGWGASVTWKLDTSTGDLSIIGSGEITSLPWLEYRQSIRNVVIGNGVTNIAHGTFSECENLTSVIIPYGVTRIQSDVFEYCHSLKNITIPDSVTSIGNMAFSKCEKLTNINLPANLTSCGICAFEDCVRLTDVAIPAGLTSILKGTFCGCTSLTNVTISDGVTEIRGEAFKYTGLKSITIPNSVTYIDIYAFDGCQNLVSVTIGSGVKAIGYAAFGECHALQNVEYNGSRLQWSRIQFEEGNEPLLQASRSYHPFRAHSNNPFVRFLIRVFLFGWIWY